MIFLRSLGGLQHLYCIPELRQKVFEILVSVVLQGTRVDIGRPEIELWKILVLGTLRLSLNWDYEPLHERVNQHCTIREMLGHGRKDEEASFAPQTLKDNFSLLTPVYWIGSTRWWCVRGIIKSWEKTKISDAGRSKGTDSASAVGVLAVRGAHRVDQQWQGRCSGGAWASRPCFGGPAWIPSPSSGHGAAER